MKEIQKLLLPYINERVKAIFAEKEQKNIRPLIATENEILSTIRTDTLECMMELHTTKQFSVTNTINQPAMVPVKEKSNNEIST